MSRHPVTPMDESDLRRHLVKQTSKRSASFDLLNFERSPAEQRDVLDQLVRDGGEVVLFDVLRAEHLEAIGALLDAHASVERPLFSVGSSGIEAALGAHWANTQRMRPRAAWKNSDAAGPMLVASGSCSPVTKRQIEHAMAEGFVEIPIPPVALRVSAGTRSGRDPAPHGAGYIDSVAIAAVDHLRAGRSVIVHTGDIANEAMPAHVVGDALGGLVRSAVEQTNMPRVIIAGGDTSSYAARTLGIEALEMIAPFVPGAPLCRAHAPGSPIDGREVIFKGGQVGSEDFFVKK